MERYDDRLEALLQEKSYTELTPSERTEVDQVLGGEAVYSAERMLRLRMDEVLREDTGAADRGWEEVRSRVRRVRPRVIPLWQAAAAALLVAMLSWWGRGLLKEERVSMDALLTTVDTVLKEVRVVDTVYLPGPDLTQNRLAVVSTEPVPDRPAGVKLVKPTMQELPDPGVTEGVRGVPAQRPVVGRGMTAYSDKVAPY